MIKPAIERVDDFLMERDVQPRLACAYEFQRFLGTFINTLLDS